MAHTVAEHRPPQFASTDSEDTATRYFQVTLDSDQLGPVTAVQAVMSQQGIFAGSPFVYRNEVAAGCRAKRIGPATGNPSKKTIYYVPVEYSTSQPDEEDSPDNPLDMPTQWGPSGTRTIKKHTVKDADGNPIKNTAGFVITEGVEVDHYVTWIEARRNVPSFSLPLLSKFSGAWNSRGYLGADEKTVRVGSIRYSEKKWQRDLAYYTLTVQLEFYPEEQFIDVLNLSYHAKFIDDANDNEEVTQQIFTGSLEENAGTFTSTNTGTPITTPVLLNEEGFIATDDDNEGTLLEVDIKKTEDFRGLGL